VAPLGAGRDLRSGECRRSVGWHLFDGVEQAPAMADRSDAEAVRLCGTSPSMWFS
jgi:hypothetical protein